FLLLIPHSSILSTLFPYTTLFRSLNELDSTNQLPKTILYSLNAKDYDVLASMAGNYQSSEIPGKVQFGTAWWFNDTINGMEKQLDRKSTRLNSSHVSISYAVFCLK